MHEPIWQGVVRTIWLTPTRGADPKLVDEAEAVASVGLRGDRFFKKSNARDPARQLTLIASEALKAAADEHGVDLHDGRHRRQIVVEGVPLNDLIGQEFMVGDVHVRGVELCEPCKRMARLSGEPGAIKALVHRGGLNVELLSGGMICTNALVRTIAKTPG
ncbi:MAG: hypothetical protein H0U74_18645 [Bradymonadaceae bacterium]|nr:hypothetical protein [Lujinxingiaceae bacterium]